MNLDISNLQESYASDSLTPKRLVETLLETIEAADNPAVWITPPDRERLLDRAEELSNLSKDLPLYGIPFVVKDNIDVAGLPTTAACPDFAYVPEKNATVVQLLLDAGAIMVGKANLDQFATGLVGVRTPYGTARNPFNADFIPGGSSSGSAVAVASNFCSFSLGTDTAGSGRIPASLNNLVGVKPTKGLFSITGVVPACRSLDCVSLFARNLDDARTVLNVAAQFDQSDAFSRKPQIVPALGTDVRIGVPPAAQLKFFGDAEAEALFNDTVERFRSQGATIVNVDFEPFAEAARLLYDGPWVTERFVAVGDFLKSHPESFHPVTKKIIETGEAPTAADLFKAEYRLQELKQKTDPVWQDVDAILTPTAGRHYKVAEVEADPVQLNSNLGTYTNFMNLLDFAALAIPAGFLSRNMPWGVTLFAPAFSDQKLLQIAEFLQEGPDALGQSPTSHIPVAVCGAHLEGQPLNWQLTDRGATLSQVTTTADCYKFYALPSIPDKGIPPRPALIFDEKEGGKIAVEVWDVPAEHFGSFVAGIPAPLGIGKVTLADSSQVSGFIAEPRATNGAKDITALSSWRTFVSEEKK